MFFFLLICFFSNVYAVYYWTILLAYVSANIFAIYLFGTALLYPLLLGTVLLCLSLDVYYKINILKQPLCVISLLHSSSKSFRESSVINHRSSVVGHTYSRVFLFYFSGFHRLFIFLIIITFDATAFSFMRFCFQKLEKEIFETTFFFSWFGLF